MANVKSALEIALEKAGKISALTHEERERVQDEERLLSLLGDFYKGRFDASELWKRMKGSKPSTLRFAQMNLINTFSIGITPEDFQSRKQAILAIETLKERQHTAVIESDLNSIEAVLGEYQGMKDKAVEDIRRQMEMHPQLRMQPVRTPDGKRVMQMMVSVDEAVKVRLSEFLSEQEEHFNEEFSALITDLKNQVE